MWLYPVYYIGIIYSLLLVQRFEQFRYNTIAMILFTIEFVNETAYLLENFLLRRSFSDLSETYGGNWEIILQLIWEFILKMLHMIYIHSLFITRSNNKWQHNKKKQ